MDCETIVTNSINNLNNMSEIIEYIYYLNDTNKDDPILLQNLKQSLICTISQKKLWRKSHFERSSICDIMPRAIIDFIMTYFDAKYQSILARVCTLFYDNYCNITKREWERKQSPEICIYAIMNETNEKNMTKNNEKCVTFYVQNGIPPDLEFVGLSTMRRCMTFTKKCTLNNCKHSKRNYEHHKINCNNHNLTLIAKYFKTIKTLDCKNEMLFSQIRNIIPTMTMEGLKSLHLCKFMDIDSINQHFKQQNYNKLSLKSLKITLKNDVSIILFDMGATMFTKTHKICIDNRYNNRANKDNILNLELKFTKFLCVIDGINNE